MPPTGDPNRIVALETPAALLTVYVGQRAAALGIQPDGALKDPRWVDLCTEAMQLFNSWMVWDYNLAIPAYQAAGWGAPPAGVSVGVQTPIGSVNVATPPPASAPPVATPTAQPVAAATTTPAQIAGAAVQAVASAIPVVNPVAAAMKAMGLTPS